MEVNMISFRQNSLDSAAVGTGPKLGIRLNQYISPDFDLNFHFLSAKSDPFEISKFIYSQSQFTQLGIDIDYKLNNGYLLPEDSRVWPFISVGYTSTSFKKIGDGDDFRIRTNTYGPGAGVSFQINSKIKAHYRVAYRHNFEDYTNNVHHQFGVTFKLFSPIRIVESTPSDSIIQENSKITSTSPDSTQIDSLVELALEIDANQLATEKPLPVKDSLEDERQGITRVLALDGKDVTESASNKGSLLVGNYYIILGAYRNLSSARNLYKRVGADVPGTAILETGLDVYRVGVLIGPDSLKVKTEKEFFRIHGFPDAWVLDNNNPVQPLLKENIAKNQSIEEEIADPDEVRKSSKEENANSGLNKVKLISESSRGDSLNEQRLHELREIRKEKIRKAGIQEGYYIVIASFLDPKNASSYRNRLSALSSDLFVIRAENGYYRVAKYVGADINKADINLRAFKDSFNPEAWLLLME